MAEIVEHKKVFISYSTEDTEFARVLRLRLETAGLDCWKAPEDILPGESWPRAITRALDESWVMVLVCSRHSIRSSEVAKELTLAMSGGVRVIPFRIENTLPTGEWAYHLANIQWFDAFDRGPDDACTELSSYLLTMKEGSGPASSECTRPSEATRRSATDLVPAYLEGLVEELQSLSDFFTMLKLDFRGRGGPRGQGPVSLDMMVKSRHTPMGLGLKTLAKSGGRKIVSGVPGCGKSTLMRMLALDAARDALLSMKSGLGQAPIPLLLDCGLYEPNSFAGLTQLREVLSRYGGRNLSSEEVEGLLESSPMIWVIDGLDEGMIGESQVNETPLWREIESLVYRYPSHAFVVSTRTSHIPTGSAFDTVNIQPLSASAKIEFISRYLNFFENGVPVDEILLALPATLLDMADTPLVLSMIVSTYINQGRVPEDTRELYGDFVSHTLRRVEAERSNRIEPYAKDQCLAALAFDMITSARVTFSKTNASASLGRRLRQLSDRGESAGTVDEVVLLDELVYSGLLVRSDYMISFAHMTLQEYFAECEMSREYSFAASSTMDQYFLRNPEKISLILKAADIGTEDHLIEVGAGIGSVAKHFPPSGSLHLVELDPELVRILRYQFPDTPVLECDALEALRGLPCDVLVSNLPFFLTKGVLDILTTKSFKRAVMSVHCEDDLRDYAKLLRIQTLTVLDEEDFFPRQPFASKLVLVEPAHGV